jgi:hypothetical protein
VHGPVWEEEPTSERPIIAAVIYLLGEIALVGLVGVIGLIALRAETNSLAALTALVGPAIGGLASILATTRTSTPARNRKGARAGLLQSSHSEG